MIITYQNGCYILQFAYDRTLVEKLKAEIPTSGRRWDGERRAWAIDPVHAAKIAKVFPGAVLPSKKAPQPSEMRELNLRYLGACKERAPGQFDAFGFTGKDWDVSFSEAVLRAWFDGLDVTGPAISGSKIATTFYMVLGIKPTVSQSEIKPAYLRMAKQWHPDVCREPNAAEMFLKIREAYDCLSNERQRARYDVGLSFTDEAASAPKRSVDLPWVNRGEYRAPLRCGYVLVEGVQGIRFAVSKIYGWVDITDQQGRTLVTSWAAGDDKFTESWI